MAKKAVWFIIVLFFLISMILPNKSIAKPNSYVSVVNPIRGVDFWDVKNQKVEDAVLGQMKIVQSLGINPTWLIRFDALKESKIINELKKSSSNHDKGLFLEITPSLSQAAQVIYHKSSSWHNAASIFLTGYLPKDREKLIDTAFDSFKNTFGFYPTSVGAWWVDSYSLGYMQKKYHITNSLIVADQFSTDSYQIWGQYFGYPYYPSKQSVLTPAQSIDDKLAIVITQWAARDPVNGYGKGVEESTYSLQPNDYIDYHKLSTDYFNFLIDLYTNQRFNQINQIVVGLENSYSWDKYQDEYKRQMESLVAKQKKGQLSIVNLKDFSQIYVNQFPQLSPDQLIVAADALGGNKMAVWFMNNYYRAGWFSSGQEVAFRDIRQYLSGQKEICYDSVCNELNFATNALRVLDDVTNHQKWILDEGKISDFNLSKEADKYLLAYKNEAGKSRQIEFLKRDIKFDGKISSIDGAILEAVKKSLEKPSPPLFVSEQVKPSSFISFSDVLNIIKFGLFFFVLIYVPGYLISKKVLTEMVSPGERVFLSSIIGMSLLAVFSFFAGFLQIEYLIYLYFGCFLILFIITKSHKDFKRFSFNIPIYPLIIILIGTVFQLIPTFQSGSMTAFGVGFWGPNGHDGVWHLALINQLVRGLPPQNPVFSGEILKNYHYLFDLLVAITYKISFIPIADLLFKWYPVLFSLLLGLGSYLLSKKLFKSNLASLISLYLVYFAGSFGWIPEYINNKSLSGESAFWANQPISLNLNQPFAISLVFLIAFICILDYFKNKSNIKIAFLLILILGCLVGFKTYAAILGIGSLFCLGLYVLIKNCDVKYIFPLFGSTVLSLAIFLPNYRFENVSLFAASGIFIFSPWWLVHTMIDYPDRVGWLKLSQARETYFQRGDYLKYFATEIVGLSLFIIGNLGIRFFGLAAIWKIKRIFSNPTLLYIFFICSLGLIIPLLFIQQGTAWNSIQFFYYLIYFSALAAGFVLYALYKKINGLFPFGGVLFLLTIGILTPINAWATANAYLNTTPHSIVPYEEVEALNWLKNQPDGIVLTYPFDKELRAKFTQPYPQFVYETTAYVSAYSQKVSYMSDEIQNDILQNDYIRKKVSAKGFFDYSEDSGKEFLQKNNIQYIYLLKYYKISLDEAKLKIKKIFENNEVSVYKTI